MLYSLQAIWTIEVRHSLPVVSVTPKKVGRLDLQGESDIQLRAA